MTRREFAISARGLLTNARIITPHGVVEGSLAIDGGRIAEIMPRSYRDGTDLRGALLMPGVIDVHTDYLEKEISPRPGPRDGYADVIATRVDGESRFAVSDAAGLAVFAR